MRCRSRVAPTEEGTGDLDWSLSLGQQQDTRTEIAAMEGRNHQGRAPRKKYRKRPLLRRRWRLTARRLNNGRSEKQLACLCVPDAWLQEISHHVNECRNLVLAPVSSTLINWSFVTF